MCEFDEKLENAHMGRLIHMLSHQMKRNSNGMESVIGNDELTVMQTCVEICSSGISPQGSLSKRY